MMENQSLGELLGLFLVLCIFAWAAFVICRWVLFALKDACWWAFEILTRVHWRLHRRFFPQGYFVGMDVGIGDDHTAIVIARKDTTGRIKVLDMRIFPRRR